MIKQFHLTHTFNITLGYKELENNGNEKGTLHSPKKQNWSLTIRCSLVSYQGHSLVYTLLIVRSEKDWEKRGDIDRVIDEYLDWFSLYLYSWISFIYISIYTLVFMDIFYIYIYIYIYVCCFLSFSHFAINYKSLNTSTFKGTVS